MLLRVAKPAFQPITLAEAKAQLRIEQSDSVEDAGITADIEAATQMVETRYAHCLTQSTWRVTMANWPARLDLDGYFRLPMNPVVSVDNVKYFNAANGEVTLTPYTDYVTDTGIGARLKILNQSGVFARPDAVQINFTCGYGAPGANEAAQQAAVPADFKKWVKMLTASFFEQRTGMVIGASVDRSFFEKMDAHLYHYFMAY